MTTDRLVPTGETAEQLARLIADAQAIPAACFERSKYAARRVIDLTVPAQRTVLRIPDATMSLVAAGEDLLAGYRR